MRGGGYLVVLAGVALVAAGCGTQRAQAVDVAAAAAGTASQRARVTVTTTTRMEGISVSFTETGVFDFAHSRGVLHMNGPGGKASEELFVPSHTYVKLAGGMHGLLLPSGKSWVAFGSAAGAGLGTALLGPFGGTDPGDLLASLTAASTSVSNLGTASVRGVRVTHLRLDVDPAKAASRVPSGQRAGLRAFAASLGAATIPVDVWVDQQNRVRRVRWSPRLPGGTGAPGATRFTQTADFYDFGVKMRVSAPPAGQVTSFSHLGNVSISSAVTTTSGPARPPRASGTLSPSQAAAAGEVVRAFWLALGRNDAHAAAQTVLPAQRMCLRSMMGAPHFTVTSLAIKSAQPDGNARATVWFTVKARAILGGQSIPVLPQGPARVQWLITAEAAGHWYVDLGRSSSLEFGPACN